MHVPELQFRQTMDENCSFVLAAFHEDLSLLSVKLTYVTISYNGPKRHRYANTGIYNLIGVHPQCSVMHIIY